MIIMVSLSWFSKVWLIRQRTRSQCYASRYSPSHFNTINAHVVTNESSPTPFIGGEVYTQLFAPWRLRYEPGLYYNFDSIVSFMQKGLPQLSFGRNIWAVGGNGTSGCKILVCWEWNLWMRSFALLPSKLEWPMLNHLKKLFDCTPCGFYRQTNPYWKTDHDVNPSPPVRQIQP